MRWCRTGLRRGPRPPAVSCLHQRSGVRVFNEKRASRWAIWSPATGAGRFEWGRIPDVAGAVDMRMRCHHDAGPDFAPQRPPRTQSCKRAHRLQVFGRTESHLSRPSWPSTMPLAKAIVNSVSSASSVVILLPTNSAGDDPTSSMTNVGLFPNTPGPRQTRWAKVSPGEPPRARRITKLLFTVHGVTPMTR